MPPRQDLCRCLCELDRLFDMAEVTALLQYPASERQQPTLTLLAKSGMPS